MENTKKKEMHESIDLVLQAFVGLDGARVQARNRYKKAIKDAGEDFFDKVKVATAGWTQDDVDAFVDLMEQDGSLSDKQVSVLIDAMNIIKLCSLIDDICTETHGSDAEDKNDAKQEEPGDKCNECRDECCDCGDPTSPASWSAATPPPWCDASKVCTLLNLLTLQNVVDTDINLTSEDSDGDINLKGLIEGAAEQWDALVAELDQMVGR